MHDTVYNILCVTNPRLIHQIDEGNNTHTHIRHTHTRYTHVNGPVYSQAMAVRVASSQVQGVVVGIHERSLWLFFC